jgi:hypothetical protein
MAAAFGDPLTVSRHEITQKTSSSYLPIQLSYSTGAKSEYVDIGVQGDGINIIDVSRLFSKVSLWDLKLYFASS